MSLILCLLSEAISIIFSAEKTAIYNIFKKVDREKRGYFSGVDLKVFLNKQKKSANVHQDILDDVILEANDGNKYISPGDLHKVLESILEFSWSHQILFPDLSGHQEWLIQRTSSRRPSR